MADADECCLVGIALTNPLPAGIASTNPLEKSALLLACTQEHTWTESTGDCSVTSKDPTGQNDHIATGQDPDICCQAGLDNGNDAILLMACT